MQTSQVDTKVVQSIDFRNWQRYYVTFDGATYDQTVHQNTNISSATTTTAGSNITTDTKQFSWPLDLTYDFTANPDGSFQQYSKIDQQFQKGVQVKLNGKQSYSSSYSDEVTPTDTLIVDANGNATTQGQANTETYQYSNSNGACWNERIRAAAGVLTSVHGGNCAH